MPYQEARDMKDDKGQPLVQHPVACVDCHEPKTMALRVTRPGLHRRHQGAQGQAGHRRLRSEPRRHPPGDALVRVRPVPRRVLLQGAGQGRDVPVGATGSRSRRSRPTTTRRASRTGCTRRPATRCSRPSTPSSRCGPRACTPARAWPARTATCPTCASARLKVSDHWVRSPLLNINRACQTCHAVPEKELEARVLTHPGPPPRAPAARGAAPPPTCSTPSSPRRSAGRPEADLQPAPSLHRKAQWRLDFVAAENSMGFHAPQELARILGEAIDHARQGQLEAERALRKP